jgi:hypothetical protein
MLSKRTLKLESLNPHSRLEFTTTVRVGVWDEQGDERVLLAEANEMRRSDRVSRPNRVRRVKPVESGSGSGFGRVACDGIPTDLLSLLEM